MSSEASPQEFNPDSFLELVQLLPSRCQPCKYAIFILKTEALFDVSGDGIVARIKQIGERCTGYEGENVFNPAAIETPRSPLKVPTTEEADVENCPYSGMDLSQQ